MDRQAPHQLPCRSPVPGYRDTECLAMDAGIEKCRLPAVWCAGLELVVGAYRNFHRFDVVPVQVPEVHGKTAIRIARPAFENRLDVLTRVELEPERVGVALGGDRSRQNGQDQAERSRPDQRSQLPRHDYTLTPVTTAAADRSQFFAIRLCV